MFSRRHHTHIIILLSVFLLIFGITGESLAQQSGRRTLPSNSISVQRVDPEVIEIARTFGSLSREEFLNWLATVEHHKVRPEAERNQSISSYLKDSQLPVLNDGDKFYNLSARTSPALKLFHREGVVKFIVFVEAEPLIESLTGTSIFVTTGLLRMIESDDQFNALVLHELAHELSDEEHREATKANNLPALRRMEMTCDAISALSLKALGMNPGALGRILYKMISWSPETMRSNNGSRNHPSLGSRLRLNELLSKALENQPLEANYPPTEPEG